MTAEQYRKYSTKKQEFDKKVFQQNYDLLFTIDTIKNI